MSRQRYAHPHLLPLVLATLGVLGCTDTATRKDASTPATDAVDVQQPPADTNSDDPPDSNADAEPAADLVDVLASVDVAPDASEGVDADPSPDADPAVDSNLLDDLESIPDAEAPDTSQPDASTTDMGPAETTQVALPPSVAEFEALLTTTGPALAEFVAAYDGPFCDADGCLFITVAPGGTSGVTILGEWSGWEDATATTMTPLPGAPNTFYAVLDLEPAGPQPYQLKFDGQWSRDPKNPYVLFGGFGFDSSLVPVGFGRLTVVAGVVSEELGNTRDLFVWLPAGYRTDPTRRFPVLYLNDGYNVFQNPKAPFGSWDVEVTADTLIASGDVEPMILVGVDTHDRLAEYTYAPIDKGDGPNVPKAAAYADFLADTVKPKIDALFRTIPDPAVTGIAGSSLGGIVSMYVGWTRPDVFGRVGSFSGAYWVGETDAGEAVGPSMRTLIDENELGVGPDDLRVYLDSGDTDFAGETAYQSDSWVYSDWTRNALIRKGWQNRTEWDTDSILTSAPADLDSGTAPASVPHSEWSATMSLEQIAPAGNLLSLVGPGHQHNEAAWRQRFGAALRFLYPPK